MRLDPSRIELRFDDGAGRVLDRVRLQVENFGLEQNLVEQVVDARALLRRDRRRERLAAELLEHDAVLQQILLDTCPGSRQADRSC